MFAAPLTIPNSRWTSQSYGEALPTQKSVQGTTHGKGGFEGRPTLATSLWPHIQDWCIGRSPIDVRQALLAMREFWRFLQRYEARGFTPITDIDDVRPEIALVWPMPPDGTWDAPLRATHQTAGRIITLARQQRSGLRDFFWTSMPPPEPRTKDLPSQHDTRNALSLLKAEAYAIFARWKRADELASTGRNLLDIPRREYRQGALVYTHRGGCPRYIPGGDRTSRPSLPHETYD